ncbi:MAG: metallophosphoesterase family protein [Cellulomonas sp.]
MLAVVHLSDLHFGAHLDTLVESLLVDVVAQRPDLVVVSGDWTQRARRAQFRRAQGFLRRLPGPVLSVVGNHDLPLFDVPRRLAAPTGRYERYLTADLDPIVGIPGLVAVGLDTMPRWRWKAGHASVRQAERVRDAWDGHDRTAWRLLVSHHPVLPPALSSMAGRRRLVGACAGAGVAILLSGHTHRPAAGLVSLGATVGRRRALSVVAGTATSTRTRGTPNAYTVLHLSDRMEAGASVVVQVREPAGQGWGAARVARFAYSPHGMVEAGSVDG